MLAFLVLASTAHAQVESPLARVESLGLDTLTVGRVTTYYAPTDRERAELLAALSEEAAEYFERELGLAFDFRLAALSPKHWFSQYPGIPIAIPWASIPERLIFVPTGSLEDARLVDFILLHEYGHLAIKNYYHPASALDDLPIPWFDELLASYYAYAFVRFSDPEWAESAKRAWLAEVESYTPRELSLDWSFMQSLPGDELGRTYAWYQFMLNLRAADLYDQEGPGFLRVLKERLPLDALDTWTTASLLPLLEEVAPGFEAWADSIGQQSHEDRGT